MVEYAANRGIGALALEVPRTDETTTDAEKGGDYVGWQRGGVCRAEPWRSVWAHPLDSISISPKRQAPNVLGHKLLAERFFTLLKENQSLLQLGLARSQ
jgi:hypothetical protein